MLRRTALLGISLLLTATACADTDGGGAGAPVTASPDARQAAFDERAERVAQAWRDQVGEAWRTGFVPLQDLTVLPDGAGELPEGVKQALSAGWYQLDVGFPREAGGQQGTIRYADGTTATVPLITRAQAYAELDQGDPPACPEASVPPPPDAPGAGGPGGGAPDVQNPVEPDLTLAPDKPVTSQQRPKPCVGLTVIAIRLGTVDLRTSRGQAEVPAWLFTIRELDAAVARVAVAQSAIVAPPQPAVEELPPVDGLVTAQDVTSVDGAKLAYRLGVGACDENITPLWHEADDVIVVGGAVTRPDGVCTEQLVFHDVTATLAAPVDARPILDAATGQVLTLTTR